MHGNVNEICARLLDSFDPQQRISLLIWTAEDVHDCTSDMNLTDDEAEAVLAEIAECSSHSRYGVGKDTVWSLAKQVREDAARDRKIEVNAEALQKVVALAAQFIRISRTNEYLTHGFFRHGAAARQSLHSTAAWSCYASRRLIFTHQGGGCCVWKACVEAVVVKRYMI